MVPARLLLQSLILTMVSQFFLLTTSVCAFTAHAARMHVSHTDQASAPDPSSPSARCFDQERDFLLADGVFTTVDEGFLVDFPSNPSVLTDHKPLPGMSGAVRGLHEGKKFIMKKSDADIQRSRSEFVAIKAFGIYFKHTGVGHVPTCCLYEASGTLLCRWLEEIVNISPAPGVMSPFFIISVLTGHYDSGTPGNTVVQGGTTPYFLDLGDCFGYTASGSLKTAHFCEFAPKTKFKCRSEDRKCFSATWGTTPYQLFDFRNGIGAGGWENGDEYFGELSGEQIKDQFVEVHSALAATVSGCCTSHGEKEIGQTLALRLHNLGLFLGKSDSIARLDERVSSKNMQTYWRACVDMDE